METSFSASDENTKILEPLLRASEVATRLNISISLAYRLMQIGEIPTVKIFHSIRVRISDLEEYVRRNWSGWQELSADFRTNELSNKG
jgi:excisionase family DNA binding protein